MTTYVYCQCGKLGVEQREGEPRAIYGPCCSLPFVNLRRWFHLRRWSR